MVSVLLVDDHQLFREGIKSLFADNERFNVVACAEGGEQALALAKEHRPHVIVMDIAMPDINGIDVTKRIMNDYPQTKIVGLSMHGDRHVVTNMLKAGAAGYLLKEDAFDDLIKAIDIVLQGKIYLPEKLSLLVLQTLHTEETTVQLTNRETRVVQLLASGEGTKEIADTLSISVKTVETHRANVMRKLNLNNLADLTRYAIRNGLIVP